MLSVMARRILCIPATSASSERTFSVAGNISTTKRNRLACEVVQDAVFLNAMWTSMDKKKKREEEEAKASKATKKI